LKEKLSIGVDGTWQDTRRNDITDSYIWQGLQDYYGENGRVLFMGCRKMQAINPWDAYFTALPMNQLIGARRNPFDWTGDCSHSWMELAWQIKAITNTHGSMKGVSYISSDAVGANWRIQARWNQFTDFTAISRSHNAKPWSGDIDIQNFRDRIQITKRDSLKYKNAHDEKVLKREETAEESIRKNRKLRYRLLPYIYSTAYETYRTGMPVCRPLLLAFPDDYRCNGDQWPYQYMFGRDILAAPVYGDFNTMEIYLPDGHQWVDFWSDEIYQGSKILQYNVSDITKLPLFIKAGAIIPMGQERNWIDPTILDTLTIHIYPYQKSVTTLYEDDGITTMYQNGFFTEQEIQCEKSGSGLHITLGDLQGDYRGKPKKRPYQVIIHHLSSLPKYIKLNGKLISEKKRRLKFSEKGWQFDDQKGCVTISTKNLSTAKNHTIQISTQTIDK